MPQEGTIVKRKATVDDDIASTFPSTAVNKELKKAKIEECTLKPVLAEEYLREVETVQVYVATIMDRRKTSQLVKMLSASVPLGSLQHLKRVRTSTSGLEIIVRPVGTREGTFPTVLDLLDSDTLEGLSHHVKVVSVPKHTPLTRRQYEVSNSMWPTQFHENKHIARVLNGKHFSKGDIRELESFMKVSVGCAVKQSARDAVTIVNPWSGKVLVTAVGCHDDGHPLQHTVLVALDLVARLQGGGAWNAVLDGCTVYKVSEEDQKVDGQLPYLCTGYDVYATLEPCLMCSMALIHSRIRRLFYGCRSPVGALGSQHKLHLQRGLNHHFQVWEGVLKKECEALLNALS